MKDVRLWPRKQLSEVCESIVDCVNKTAPTVDSETPYKMIRTTNVKGGRIDLTNVNYVSEETFQRWTRRQTLKRGDVILTREAPLGEVGFLRESDGVFLGQRLVCYRANPKLLDNSFLLYSMQGREMQNQIKSFGSGSTVEHMRVPDAERLTIALPPIQIQQRIGGILSAYDDLIENNLRRIKILEEMARLVYREWFMKFRFPGHKKHERFASPLGDIPKGWEVKKLKDVCRLTMGQSPKSEFYNETGDGQPFHQGVTDFGERFPTDHLFCTVEGRIAEAGDILFSVRAPVGRLNIADKKLIIGRGLSAIRHFQNHQAFLWEQLKSRFTKDDMMGNGAIFAAVTKNDMESIEILCPPQSLIVNSENHFVPLHNEIGVLTRQIQNLRRTRDLLLPRLISGQLDLRQMENPIRS